MKKTIIALVFLLFISQSFAWYNDAGNDSCLVASSDEEVYYLAEGQNQFQATYKIQNDCGNTMNATIGTYFENKIQAQIDIQHIKTNSIDANWSTLSTPIVENQITIAPSFQAGYTAKAKANNVFISKGISYMQVLMKVPITGKKEEFVLVVQNPLSLGQKTTLDPFWDAEGTPADYNVFFYEPFASGNEDANWSGDNGSYTDAAGYLAMSGGSAHDGLYRNVQLGLTDFNLSVRVWLNSSSNNLMNFWVCGTNAAKDPNDGYRLEIDPNGGGHLRLLDDSDQRAVIGQVVTGLSNGVWIDYNLSRSTAGQFFLYEDGAFVGNSSINEFGYVDCEYISLTSQVIGSRWDEIQIWNIVTPALNDLNIASVDDYGIENPFPVFAYEIDGNLTVDFNVFHESGTKGTIDLLYGASYIVDDLDLSSTDVCPDQDFTTRSACSWDWNIHRSLVPDGNYVISGEISFIGGQTASDTVTNSLRVGNDVNVLVKIPIDEDTLSIIDVTSEYRFNISLLDDTNLTLFNDLNEDIYLSLRKGTSSPIILTVDTNDSTAYLSRNYYFTFTTETDYTLQPYLVPVTQGISTKVITQDVVDYSPIPNVTIQVYRSVPETGRTLIETVVTDSKGEGFLSGVANETYEYVVTFEGNLIENFNITVTSTLVTILFKQEILPPDVEGPTLTVNFTPISGKLLSGQNNLVQNISISNGSISWVKIYATEINFADRTQDVNRFSGQVVPDTNSNATNTVQVNVDLASWDTNRPIVLTVLVEQNGNWHKYQTNYQGYQATQITSQVLEILMVDIATEIGCETVEGCGMLTAISVILTIVACAAIITLTPFKNMFGVSVLGALFLSFFTFLGWVPFYWWFIVVLFVVVAGVVEWRR